MFANAELRFPLIEAALTPIGVIGGVRGVFFAGIGGALVQQPAVGRARARATRRRSSSSTNNATICQVPTGVKTDALGNAVIDHRPGDRLQTLVLNYAPRAVDGFRLQDGRASYGIGLETFALGFPIHFDWSWRTLFNKGWEDVVFACRVDATASASAAPTSSASRASRSGSATTSEGSC